MSLHRFCLRIDCMACCACADERLRGTKVCDREGNLKPDTHFIFSALPDSSLAAEGQPALKLAPPHPSASDATSCSLYQLEALQGGAKLVRFPFWASLGMECKRLADCAQSLLRGSFAARMTF